MMNNSYYVSSNRESGLGRFDIQLMPKPGFDFPEILIELKAEKHISADDLCKLAQKALDQINEKEYATDMIAKGVKNMLKYGIAFSGKNVEIAME